MEGYNESTLTVEHTEKSSNMYVGADRLLEDYLKDRPEEKRNGKNLPS